MESATLPARAAHAEPQHKAQFVRHALNALVCLAVAAPIAIYLWIALHRVDYPYEIDWMEGGSVELAGRVLAGHSLYASPSLSYVGWTYTPLYYWLAAAVAKLTGLGFQPLRLISLVASLLSMETLGWMVAKETGSRVAGLVAAGLFAATFHLSGSWFDTGRVDSLFLALTLLALARARWARGITGGIALGALAFLAFFTKQSALIALVPVLLLLVLARPRVGVPALVTLTALTLGSTLILNSTTHGWYVYYVFTELLHQPVAQPVWITFWTHDILHQEWPLVILVGGGAAVLALVGYRGETRGQAGQPKRRRRTAARAALTSPALFYATAAAGLIGAAWVSRLHTGGYLNVLMPAYAATALLGGLICGALSRESLSPGHRPAPASLKAGAPNDPHRSTQRRPGRGFVRKTRIIGGNRTKPFAGTPSAGEPVPGAPPPDVPSGTPAPGTPAPGAPPSGAPPAGAPSPDARPAPTRPRTTQSAATAFLLTLTILLQLALLIYPIAPQIPTAADRAAGAALIARLRTLPGPILVLRHPWYATLAGKGTFAQEEAIGDVLRSAETKGSRPLRKSLATALNTDHIQTVVLDGTFDAHFLRPELARYFRLAKRPITRARLYPLTDVRTAPTLVYRRVRPAPRPARARRVRRAAQR